MLTNLLSYTSILNDRASFRKAGTRSGDEFNYFETPLNTYFKIFFYFHNDDAEYSGIDGGLLAPTWEIGNNEYYRYNSAWSYLKMNGENERAEKLKQFVLLLSNISSKAPWTFETVSGLDEALNRNINEMKVEEERKKISIKCSKDSFDTRVGTLLDLYRDVVWSWKTKREIIPSNLRKFDMGIYIFSDPITNIHQGSTNKSATIGLESSGYHASAKYIELHNCELDYNSSKSGYGDLNNIEGKEWEYTIDIMFDDIYEDRYNEFMMRKIGDMIEHDTKVMMDSMEQTDNINWAQELQERSDSYQSYGFVDNALKEIIGAGKGWVTNKLNSAILGNLFTASLPTIGKQLEATAKGQVFTTVNALDEYVVGNYKPKRKEGDLGNIFTKEV